MRKHQRFEKISKIWENAKSGWIVKIENIWETASSGVNTIGICGFTGGYLDSGFGIPGSRAGVYSSAASWLLIWNQNRGKWKRVEEQLLSAESCFRFKNQDLAARGRKHSLLCEQIVLARERCCWKVFWAWGPPRWKWILSQEGRRPAESRRFPRGASGSSNESLEIGPETNF